MRPQRHQVIAALLAGMLYAACSSIDCPVENTVSTHYMLHKADMSTDTLNGRSLSVFSRRSDGTDTLLLGQLTSATAFSLPIGYANPEDTLYFYLVQDTLTTLDTVWIKKENMPHFESVDCSASYFHQLTAVRHTHNGIDSIVINNPSVNYDTTTEHFYIYFKARR